MVRLPLSPLPPSSSASQLHIAVPVHAVSLSGLRPRNEELGERRRNPGAGLEQHSNGLTQHVKCLVAAEAHDLTKPTARKTLPAGGGRRASTGKKVDEIGTWRKAIDANTKKGPFPQRRRLCLRLDTLFCFRSTTAARKIYDAPSNCLLTIC